MLPTVFCLISFSCRTPASALQSHLRRCGTGSAAVHRWTHAIRSSDGSSQPLSSSSFLVLISCPTLCSFVLISAAGPSCRPLRLATFSVCVDGNYHNYTSATCGSGPSGSYPIGGNANFNPPKKSSERQMTSVCGKTIVASSNVRTRMCSENPQDLFRRDAASPKFPKFTILSRLRGAQRADGRSLYRCGVSPLQTLATSALGIFSASSAFSHFCVRGCEGLEPRGHEL